MSTPLVVPRYLLVGPTTRYLGIYRYSTGTTGNISEDPPGSTQGLKLDKPLFPGNHVVTTSGASRFSKTVKNPNIRGGHKVMPLAGHTTY